MASDAFLSARALDDDRVVDDIGDATAHAQLDPGAFDLLRGDRAETVPERCQRLVPPVEQQHPRARGGDPPEVSPQRPPRGLGGLPPPLNAPPAPAAPRA